MLENNTIVAAVPKRSTINLMKRLIKTYVMPHSRILLLAIFFMIIDAATTAGVAKLMQPILDDEIGRA
jgi:hypothetical protein